MIRSEVGTTPVSGWKIRMCALTSNHGNASEKVSLSSGSLLKIWDIITWQSTAKCWVFIYTVFEGVSFGLVPHMMLAVREYVQDGFESLVKVSWSTVSINELRLHPLNCFFYCHCRQRIMVKYPILLSCCPAKYSFVLANDVMDEVLHRYVIWHKRTYQAPLSSDRHSDSLSMIAILKMIRDRGGGGPVSVLLVSTSSFCIIAPPIPFIDQMTSFVFFVIISKDS